MLKPGMGILMLVLTSALLLTPAVAAAGAWNGYTHEQHEMEKRWRHEQRERGKHAHRHPPTYGYYDRGYYDRWGYWRPYYPYPR